MPAAAFAQSTGTVETEKDTIVVTGTRAHKGTDGIVIQDSTKAKGLVTQEYIAKQSPGQTLLNTINYIPGVNFTQNDAYGSSGVTFVSAASTETASASRSTAFR